MYMVKKTIVLSAVIMMFAFVSVNAQMPPAGDLAKGLANLSVSKKIAAFKEFGKKTSPMPGESESIAIGGLFVVQAMGLSTFQQWFIYNFVWGGKTFHEDTTKLCSTENEKSGRFWLTNDLKTIAAALDWLPGGSKAWVYRSNDSWIKDGLPTIYIDYDPSMAFSGWIHDEIRFAGRNPNGTACYMGIMWVFLGGLRTPAAYFIPDQVTTSNCPMN
jgi:hypothetical protein